MSPAHVTYAMSSRPPRSRVTGPENDASHEDAAPHAPDHLVERALTVAGRLAG